MFVWLSGVSSKATLKHLYFVTNDRPTERYIESPDITSLLEGNVLKIYDLESSQNIFSIVLIGLFWSVIL